ncbi:olfactory receptor 13G1-like [Perca flavescens]|uniref:olfactory receptor 13G1-like n=1 Tax=Perca flavescens TaxID=8167 RepID=UPI00106DF03D|nr:olfactory receptor 13G1-like [Perca flavescens]
MPLVWLLIIYVLAVLANILNILFIIYDKRLHKPMYLLICNLAVVDLLLGVILTLEARHGLTIGSVVAHPLLNPLVYCLRTKEIKCKIFRIFKKVETPQ